MSLDLQFPLASNFSTGYLQDAVAEWGDDRCKRRCVLMFSDDDRPPPPENVDDPLFATNNCVAENIITIPAGDPLKNSSIPFKEAVTQEETMPEPPEEISFCSSCFKEDSTSKEPDNKDSFVSRERQSAVHESGQQEKKKRLSMRLAYPFTVVKPGGIEGEITLKDINKRMLKRPMRPVRHPVGEFAYVPCTLVDGPGLSGKVVVGLTRIHTQGRGTITIIRTRG